MIRRLCAAVIAILVMFTCILTFAHSGRTDASGGHYNRSTGEYHYHHGYSAHQHPNGVCPYIKIDNAGQSSNSGGANSSVTTKNSDSIWKSEVWAVVALFLVVICAFLIMIIIISVSDCKKMQERYKNISPEDIEKIKQIKEYETELRLKEYEIQSQKRTIEADNKRIEQKESIIQFYENNVVFMTKRGKHYHKYDCRHIKKSNEWQVCSMKEAQSKGYTPCAECYFRDCIKE